MTITLITANLDLFSSRIQTAYLNMDTDDATKSLHLQQRYFNPSLCDIVFYLHTDTVHLLLKSVNLIISFELK